MSATKMLSKKAANEEAAKQSSTIPEIPVHLRSDVVKIAPITTYNDWVILIPFMVDTGLALPVDAEYRNVGIVVGKSETMMTPHGEFVPSRLEYGQVVLFQKRSVVAEMAVTQDPYIGKRMVILSEKNIVCSLVPVKFEIVKSPIVLESIPRE